MGKKILLADDSITIQKVIELTFSDEDFEVVTVGNGRLAVEKVTETRPDIVLCDIIMPEKDGYEVCEFIKKNPSLSHIPVLLLTGAFEPFDQEKANKAGADGYLAKPFEPQALVAKVKDVLSKAPARSGGRPAAAPAAATAPASAPASAPPAAAAPPAPAEAPEHETEFTFEAPEDQPATFADADAEVEELTAEPEPEEEEPPQAEAEPEPEAEPVFEAEGEPEAAAEAATPAASMAEAPDDPARYAPPPAEPPPWERPGASAVSNETSFAGGKTEPPYAPEAPPPSVAGEVSVPTDMVEKIAQRVVAQVSEKLIREIAWEVIPDLAEALITKEIERLKAELQQT